MRKSLSHDFSFMPRSAGQRPKNNVSAIETQHSLSTSRLNRDVHSYDGLRSSSSRQNYSKSLHSLYSLTNTPKSSKLSKQMQQKLVLQKLTCESFQYQQLLIDEATIDIDISRQQLTNSQLQRAQLNQIKGLKILQLRISTLKSALAQLRKHVQRYYKYLGRNYCPQTPDRPLNQRLQLQNQVDEMYQQSLALMQQQSRQYNQTIDKLNKHIKRLNTQNQSMSLQLRRIKVRNNISMRKYKDIHAKNQMKKLQARGRQLILAQQRNQLSVLQEQMREMQEYTNVLQNIKLLPEVHSQWSKVITQDIVRQIHKQTSELQFQIPEMWMKSRASTKHTEVLKFRLQARCKKAKLYLTKVQRAKRELSQLGGQQNT